MVRVHFFSAMTNRPLNLVKERPSSSCATPTRISKDPRQGLPDESRYWYPSQESFGRARFSSTFSELLDLRANLFPACLEFPGSGRLLSRWAAVKLSPSWRFVDRDLLTSLFVLLVFPSWHRFAAAVDVLNLFCPPFLSPRRSYRLHSSFPFFPRGLMLGAFLLLLSLLF